jgi:AMIN domain
MKMAMKLTTGILAIAVTTAMGSAFSAKAVAQSTDEIDNARSLAKSLQQKQANDTNAALDAAGVTAPSTPTPAKPAPGAPAPAVKPAAIPGAKPASVAAAPAAAQKSKPAPVVKAASASASSAHNQLQKVNVVSGADTIQIEISSSQPVTPKVSKLASPARILVELPETSDASALSKIPVGAGGVKGVRIGMDGKTPPTTSVVIDLDKALAYELTPGPAGKAILTLHTQGGSEAAVQTSSKSAAKSAAKPAAQSAAQSTAQSTAKTSPVPVKAAAPASKPAAVASVKAPAAKPSQDSKSKKDSKQQAKATAPAKTTVVAAKAPASDPMSAKLPKSEEKKADDKKAEEKKAEEKKPEDKKWAMSGKRDPFFSPVVQQGGSGCSTGKKCLEIGAINLRGVVKSDSGFIAVVTNNLNKAYFLRENDPVFNGYVVKITGDSVVFQETLQDKLGKTFTREVVKRIFTPAV